MRLKDEDVVVDSLDSDQEHSYLGVHSFAHTCLSQNLELFRNSFDETMFTSVGLNISKK